MLNLFSIHCRGLIAVIVWLGVTSPAIAQHVLLVGPSRPLRTPSAAAAVVKDGDTVRIDPGVYDDCAVWRANRLHIVAAGPGVVLRNLVCQAKGIFVTVGNDITVRGITFAHAHAPSFNGAGIRVEGNNLTVIESRFIDNEDGILAAPAPTSVLRVIDSDFRGNGSCMRECAHGLYANKLALVDIEHSNFIGQHVGHNVKSRALRTILIDNVIEDGPNGTSSYLVDLPNGGDLLMRGNTLEKGPKSENPLIAITIGEESVRNPTEHITVIDNRFRNDLIQPTTFLRNLTPVQADLRGNTFQGPIVALDGPGAVRP